MRSYTPTIAFLIAVLSLYVRIPKAYSAAQCTVGIDYSFNGTSPIEIKPHEPSELRTVQKSEYQGCTFYSASCLLTFKTCSGGQCDTGLTTCTFGNYYESGVLKGSFGQHSCPSNVHGRTGPVATADEIQSGWDADFAIENSMNPHTVKSLDHMECQVSTQIDLPQTKTPANPEPQQSCSNGSSAGGNVRGSNIECRDGIVHQSLAITGTPYSLNYSSRESVAGSATSRNLKVNIPTYNIPGYKFRKVIFTTTLANRAFTKSYNLNGIETFGTDLDISQIVNWDGKDAAGNFVYGQIKAVTTAQFDMERLDAPGALASFRASYINIFDNNTDGNRFKMNGWTLSSYHRFEPSTSTIYAGFGLRIPLENKAATPSWYRDASNNYYVPSQDASEIYKFSSAGLHLQTLNADLNAPIFTFQHDASNRLISVTDRNGLITSLQRDASGNLKSITSPTSEVTAFTLDTANLIATIKDPLLNITKFTYGTGTMAGLMLSYTNPRAFVKYYTYNSQGKLIQSKDYKGAIRTFATTYDPNDAAGSKTTLTSPLGRTSTFYSNLGYNSPNIFTNILPDGSQTETTISGDGKKVKIFSAGSNETMEEEFVANPRFKDRLVSSKVTASAADGTQSVASKIESYTFQAANNPLNILTKIKTSNLQGLGDFSTSFDKASLTYTSTSPSGRKVTAVVNAKGDPVKVTYGNLAPIQYTYDTRGRLSSVQQSTRTSTFTYDAKDLLATAKNALGDTTSFAYDADRQLKTLTFPNNKTLGFILDANGNPTKITVPSLQAYQNVFDKKDLYTSQSDPSIAGSAFTRSYLYSPEDELTQITHPDTTLLNFSYNSATGHLDRATGPSIDRTYTFSGPYISNISTNNGLDSVGINWIGSRVASMTWGGRITGMIEYTWAAFDRLASISVNSQKTADYTYTPEGELKTVNGLSFTRSATTGLVSATAVGNVKTSKTYNTFGEILTESATLGSTTLYSISYTRDALGRISGYSRTEAGATSNVAFTYDKVGQFLTETVGTTTTLNYTYDSDGNRLSIAGAETYDEQDRLVSDSLWTYVYNKNGYLSKKTNKANASTVTYAYDNLGNLLQVKNSTGSTVDYTIDGMSNRVVRKLNNTFTDGFLYQSSIQPAAQLNSNGSIKAYFVYGSQFNSPDLIIKGGVTYRVIHDQLGSPIFVINTSNSTVVQKVVYDTWGRVKSDSNPGFQPFGFAGGLYDSTTGLLRYGARDYDPSIGRWLNKDPIKFSGGWNLYQYVGNDPVNAIDPDGLRKLFVFQNKKLSFYDDDGSLLFQSNALSGPYGAGPIPKGKYAVGNFRDHRTQSYSCQGSTGYSLDIISRDEILRENLRIHPDGGVPGTLGCVGVTCSLSGGANQLGDILRRIYSSHQTPYIELEVK